MPSAELPLLFYISSIGATIKQMVTDAAFSHHHIHSFNFLPTLLLPTLQTSTTNNKQQPPTNMKFSIGTFSLGTSSPLAPLRGMIRTYISAAFAGAKAISSTNTLKVQLYSLHTAVNNVTQSRTTVPRQYSLSYEHACTIHDDN